MKCKSLLLNFTVLLCTVFVARNVPAATFTLTINVSGSGTVSRNPTNSAYPGGATVILTATPAADWLFAGWSGDATGTTNPLNVTMTSNKVIQANFVEVPRYTLNRITNGMGAITLSPPGGIYLSNSTVQAQASPEPGWVFLNWSGDANGSSNPLAVLMNANKNIAANFAQGPQITAQPQSVTAGSGTDVTFNVTATGTQPLGFQWRFNDSPINGATGSSLVVSNVQTTSVGLYTVVVSNVAGSVTSNPASLEIANGCSGSNVITECTEAALRSAIANGGLVRFCCNGTIVLSNTITIFNQVALDATDFSVAISGNNAVRLFLVSTGASFYLTNLALVNGLHRGADAAGVGNPAEAGEGGAILNKGGTVCLVSCGLTNNQAIGGTSDTDNPVAAPGRGGALANQNGMVLLQSVKASRNTALGGSNGSLSGNVSDAQGGVVFNEGGTIVIRNSVLQSNVALASPSGFARVARPTLPRAMSRFQIRFSGATQPGAAMAFQPVHLESGSRRAWVWGRLLFLPAARQMYSG